ncbi:ArsA family ATPase [Gephyromycinifex aptenodytis]|uniref:ArsA family ATPase n=1 Tax=Gephyromycinifex aptenodytis TaxID=2716227 RepID=UPI0014487272|nr:ArsA family ATPase [Gephyromycinifex aptenodytis]
MTPTNGRPRGAGAPTPATSGNATLGQSAAGSVLDIDALLDNPATRIVVCCGSGGVGKTTTAAALALRGAERGRRVAVLTIDPARRLAQSLGLTELDNTPRAVAQVQGQGGGSLDAMMLDMKRTFDEVVQAHTTPEKAAQILANPFYQALSSSFAGTQEYMAMEKLGQLYARRGPGGEPAWDLIVVDTPPSRSALDFLDAPARLGSFLDGRFIRLLLAPAKAGGRAYVKVLSVGVSAAAHAMSKLLGTQMLHEVQMLVAALDTMFGGFRERADQTYALLQQPGTAFLVVATPERDALREAGYFIDRLRADDMPLTGVVVNRVHLLATAGLTAASAEQAADALLQELPEDPTESASAEEITEGLLRLHSELATTAARHRSVTDRFGQRHPGVRVATVPAASHDIHDVQGLREIGTALARQNRPAG